MTQLPIDPPSPVAIARALCSLTAKLEDDINFERGCLEEAFESLSLEPPDLEAARKTLANGIAHAFRKNHREERPESWLVAACAQLLRDQKTAA